MPLSPDWSNLPKRKCDDCGKNYKPKVPMRKGERGFCSANCRKSYHKHGGAYRKLRGEMEKLVAKRMGELEKQFREIVREELSEVFTEIDDAAISIPLMRSLRYRLERLNGLTREVSRARDARAS